jgi:hypothetical protein
MSRHSRARQALKEMLGDSLNLKACSLEPERSERKET